ncbi:MAG TPA: 2-hydroxychromene-2-carboxylate isomerase, partial [Caulobacteraceae bacterium]|nr:2-hydroxychromene-2-carboxylate isomerase [Caulobacteraceae bacterium]
PYSYLALSQLGDLAARQRASIEFTPISVLAVMKLTDNSPTTIISKAKGAYAMADIGRWARRYGVPVGRDRAQRQVDDPRLLAGAAIAGELGQIEPYARAVFGAVWGDGPAITDDGVLAGVLRAGGVRDIEAILADRERGAAIIDANVTAAAEAGVFGVPSFTTGGELFFGNDRLNFLEEALAA